MGSRCPRNSISMDEELLCKETDFVPTKDFCDYLMNIHFWDSVVTVLSLLLLSMVRSHQRLLVGRWLSPSLAILWHSWDMPTHCKLNTDLCLSHNKWRISDTSLRMAYQPWYENQASVQKCEKHFFKRTIPKPLLPNHRSQYK